MHRHGKTLLRAAAAVATAAPLALLPSSPAGAHGSMEYPLSRVIACYQENPESPSSAACRAAVAAGGTQAFYDWNGVRIGDAAGRHRQIIPDGRLCSAGDPAFRGLDLARADWPATRLKAGTDYTFRFRVTAVHRGGFQLFITKDGYDPTRPLTWSSLESQPFLTAASPTATGGYYHLAGRIPAGKTGRHLVYAIWQRTDSPEAFYSCSDIVLGGSDGGAAPVPQPPAPQPSASSPAQSPRPSGKPTKPGQPTKSPKPGKPTTPPSCPPGGGHGNHHAAALPEAKPASGTSALTGQDPKGMGLIAGAVGLAIGGVTGLLLTTRRRPSRARL
ncbi:lytic polysaccharide monooxygenase [Actinocorallia sp. API 0066]|uniref:lytic polysaccharide monooxygenase auxiliary activity family 9 protein n=1 Tax=Actinocorallia sp. API 0066 TaxID=2896846 RepID=UPI002714FA5B|nr:lytic polysaccharide monooxygenase [Actinocorallia sp. API 0066]